MQEVPRDEAGECGSYRACERDDDRADSEAEQCTAKERHDGGTRKGQRCYEDVDRHVASNDEDPVFQVDCLEFFLRRLYVREGEILIQMEYLESGDKNEDECHDPDFFDMFPFHHPIRKKWWLLDLQG